jgi:LPXTG-site transpeptidase (sortase) family protein
MMVRDRTKRAFSLFVLFAGSAALVVGAGAEWSGAPVHASSMAAVAHVARAHVQQPTTKHQSATLVATPRRVAPKVKKTADLLSLPRSLPATLLPAGTALPVPAPLPANPWAPRQPTQLGRIEIPAIGLDQPFFEGVDQAAFAHGVGHWPGTAAPGAWGNAVFGGHRVTQTHPFLNTDRLHAGDEIDFVMLNGWTYVYRVTSVIVVPQTALWIADQKPGRLLTLFTCNPKGSATERLVTNGVLDRIVAAT